MNTIKLRFIILLFFFCLQGIGQNQAVLRAYYDDADYDISQEDYANALVKLLKIYNQDSTNANINYLIGMCYLNSVDLKKKSLFFLKKAVTKISPTYQSETYTERGAPYDSYNLIGDALALEYQFDKAIEYYNRFLITIKKNNQELIGTITRKIRSCEYGKILTEKPIVFEKKNLSTINSIMSDFNPVLTPDQKLIFYTSQQGSGKPGEEKLIFKSINQGGKWVAPINYTLKLSQASNMITSFVSRDGKSLLLIDDDESGNSIHETKMNQNVWTTPKKIPKKLNSGTIQPDAFISRDGKTIYFSSNRKGGFGGLDIYKSEKEAGEWSEPINLGPIINTPYDDKNPRILEDNSLLFFSSKGHSSIGGYDIFYSSPDAKGNWEEPKNIGYPLNTTDDETDYWPVKDGFSGYMSRFEESGLGEKDIYFITINSTKENLTVSNLSQNVTFQDTTSQNKLQQNTPDTTAQNTANNSTLNSNDTSSLMTILIKVTRNPLESAYLREIDGVRAYRGQDSLIRYYYGQYRNFEDASKDFDKILKIGFYSAQLKNVKEDTLYYYASSNLSFDLDSSDVVPDYSENNFNTETTDSITNKVLTDQKNTTEKKDKTNQINNNENKQLTDNKEAEDKKEIEKNQKLEAERVKQEEKQKQKELEKKQKQEEKEKQKEIEKQKELEKNQKLEAERIKQEEKEKQKELEKKQKLETDRIKKEELKSKDTVVNKTRPLLNEITDRLVKATGDIFTIQISTVPKAGNLEYFKNLPYTTEHDCKDGKYRYTTGVFENAEDARKYLEEIKAKGYTDAYILNFNKARTKFYNEDITEHIRTYNLNYDGTQMATTETKEEEKLYSIQIASSIKPVEDGYFKGVSDVKEKLTQNGFFKYYYGKFNGYKDAKIELEKARELGYKDAFIIKYADGETKSNVTKTEKEKTTEQEKELQNAYTIQVASAKKQSDLKYFKGIEVSEVKGNNGFYIYIYGDFKTVAAARKELTKVKDLGFKDAFINRSEKYK